MLLATARTKDALLKSIERFYGGVKMEITEGNEIRRASDGKILESVIVRKKGKRYRFERV